MQKTSLRIIYNVSILSEPLCSSIESYGYFKKIWNKNLIELQEQVNVAYLNNNNQVTCWNCLNTGNSNETLFDVKLALSCGLGCMASKILIAHNHPGGILRPSMADLGITRRLYKAAALMEIELIDHLIIDKNNYYSMADHELLKF